MAKQFKKKDLKTGMQIKLRKSGKRYIILLGTPNGDVYVEIGGKLWGDLNEYSIYLKCKHSADLDIVEVFSNVHSDQYTSVKMDDSDLIWQREEPKPILTLDGVDYSEETLRSLIKKATS